MNAAERETVDLAGLPIDRLDASQVSERIFSELAQGRGGWVLTANVDFIQRAAEDPSALQLYRRADLVVADGIPLLWAAKLRGQPLPGRVAGSDLVGILAEGAAREGRSLYLLGGEGDAAEQAASRLVAEHPALKIVGTSSPWLSLPPEPEQLEKIRNDVVQAQPDIVYVAFGSPKQELVIDALRKDLPATWLLGCGISLSFLAGDLPRAPGWMQRNGLEWIHRLSHEPLRLAPRYLMRNLPFAIRLLFGAARDRRS